MSDVLGLGGLVATTQQDEDDALTTCEIHPIPRSDIDAHFAHSTTNRSSISQIPKAGRIEPGQDASFGAHVAQRTKPLAEDVRLSELIHRPSVSVRLHSVNVGDGSNS